MKEWHCGIPVLGSNLGLLIWLTSLDALGQKPAPSVFFVSPFSPTISCKFIHLLTQFTLIFVFKQLLFQ